MLGSVGFDAKLGVGRVGSLCLLGIWSSGRPTEFTEIGPRIPGPRKQVQTYIRIRNFISCPLALIRQQMNPALPKLTLRLLLRAAALITELEETRALGSRKPGPGRENQFGKNLLFFLTFEFELLLSALDLSSTLNRGMVIFPSFHFVCGFKVNPFD